MTGLSLKILCIVILSLSGETRNSVGMARLAEPVRRVTGAATMLVLLILNLSGETRNSVGMAKLADPVPRVSGGA